MTPSEAVTRLAELIAPEAEFEEDEVYSAMFMAGMNADVADRAFKFTQIAWGRAFLNGVGVNFSPDYFCFDGSGNVIEAGQLANQPYFIAAMELAKRYIGMPGFNRMVLASADVISVNKALNAGSKPENLVSAPAALFMEPPTPEGMDKAKQIILGILKSPEKIPSAKLEVAKPEPQSKPWWMFW